MFNSITTIYKIQENNKYYYDDFRNKQTKNRKENSNIAFDYFRDNIKNPNSNTILKDLLNKLGWKYLDEGLYSMVFYNSNKSYILKINNTEDDAFHHFVNIIHLYKNPHFPKISDMKELTINDKTFHIYLIESLKDFDMYDAQDIGDFLYDLVEKIIKNKNWKIKEIINQILKMKRTHPIEVADRILKSPKLNQFL